MFWKLAIVVLLPLLLYGRSGLMKHPVFRLLMPATLPSARRDPAQNAKSTARRDSRVFIVLVTLAAVAVGSWIIARAFIDRS